MKENFRKALVNIARHGDTDIFPFPFERHLFEEKQNETLAILESYHANIDDAISSSPVLTLVKLSQVGYYGFRQATLIEPFWNAYFLGLVISIAEDIEKKRIKEEDKNIFSYRFEWDEASGSLFKNTTWIDYKKQCIENAKEYKYVLQTDISNFYPRINHHKLENELKRIDTTNSVTTNLMKLLSAFTGTISYGLPVGGPASRILAELALNHSDFNLKSRDIKFCRYADDYTIFCKNESKAYKTLIFLSEKLSNDQLGLQKDKTKIMTSEEFIDIHKFLDPQPNDANPEEEQKLLNISIRFDPYSATAVEDYEYLKEAIKEIDIISILSKEVNKTRIDQTVTKQAINSIKVLNPESQVQAVKILLDHTNLVTLSPVFTSIMRSVRSIYMELSDEGKDIVDNSLIDLFKNKSFLTKIEMNVTYMIQILSIRHSAVKEALFIRLFETETNHLLKRQIIIAMSNWGCHYWIVDIKNNFTTLTNWERRAVIYASYFLGDEGKHWRNHNKKSFSKEETLIRDWFTERIQANKNILV
ncbi:RNA-directed DNA polymerase [Elizabethkingia anophelis]|uniref:RNA-directed DNA polymerase n=1 Tax=Elizabethkingia anophelis TaxID=1117645 RepID=UPI0020B7E052|nr:RNA-directed DNA polymerase [Elizabethkingia anophelis]UTG61520.1 RNA-directed DNA polymerase [Elizabethkingia anophelis]UXM67763.1 RNA-directed DNA polymerase [Elizabethkingia anophelis]